MIRSNTPHPYLFRQRDGRGLSGRDKSRAFVRVTSGVPRAARDRRKLIHHSGVAATWSEFLSNYEQFTDVLCVAAKSGCTERLEREYVALRFWFLQQYPHHAHRVRALISTSTILIDATLPTVSDMTTGEKRQMDAFESLFLPKALSDVLSGDRGDLIHRVSTVSLAVYCSLAKTKQ